MHLFIDTNVFLNFYHLSGEDIEQLRKLVQLIEHKEVTLWLPSQVCDEFARNRDGKIADAMKSVTRTLKVTMPAFYRHKDDFKEISETVKKLNKKLSTLIEEVDKEIVSEELDADSLIEEIFEKAEVIEIKSKLLNAAIERMRRGNPPGKGNGSSVGDEINWEALLANVPEDTDIHVVSVDGDYASVRDDNKPHAFLSKEWSDENGGKMFLYKGISEFFGEHFKHIKLASDVAKSKAITRLASSGSFATTHNAIAKLSPLLGTFTAAEAKTLIETAENNSQVGWIMVDDDVRNFFVGLGETVQLSDDLAERLEALLPDDDQD